MTSSGGNQRGDRPGAALLRARLRAGEVSPEELRRLLEDPRASVRAMAAAALRKRSRDEVEARRLEELLVHERRLWERGVRYVAGLDEVGAGTLAGPLVAAAVVLRPNSSVPGVDDSKKLPRARREQIAAWLRREAVAFAFGVCSPAEVDELNVLAAGLEAMRRATVALDPQPEHLLVDARRVPGVAMPQTELVGGDRRSQAIAAASVLAKVERDAMMEQAAREYPGYGFERHRGYATEEHLDAIARLGPSPIHRTSFSPVIAGARGMNPRPPRQLSLW